MRILTVTAVLAAAGVASAQVWNEVGDAGQDGVGAAQVTDGSGPLTTINGVLGTDVDLYAIRIDDVATFEASVIGGATFDTQMFLFAADGTGITENEDADGELQALVNSDGILGVGGGPGLYYLAISEFNQDPLDSDGIDMFGFTTWPGRGDQRQPTSTLSLVNWDDNGGDGGDYSIRLTGASYAVPAPASLALLGLGGLAAARRRR